EAIVNSRARERRLLIEEAAGLGKHRKRRRRAQVKLERTQENLDRALDVEREARTRLRPLKRQAEAAQLHERLEHQILQARLEGGGDRSEIGQQEAGAADRSEIGEQLRERKERLSGLLAEHADVQAAASREVESALEVLSAELAQSTARVEAVEEECGKAEEE